MDLKEEIMNEMDEKAVPDFEPDWKFAKKPVQVFTLKNGVFSRLEGGTRALEREKKTRNGLFTCESATADIVLINYDRDDARPYVKALMAKANKLREVKLLYLALALSLVQIMIFVGGWIVLGKQIGEVGKIVPQAVQAAEQAKQSAAKISEAEAKALFDEQPPAKTPESKYENFKIQ